MTFYYSFLLYSFISIEVYISSQISKLSLYIRLVKLYLATNVLYSVLYCIKCPSVYTCMSAIYLARNVLFMKVNVMHKT